MRAPLRTAILRIHERLTHRHILDRLDFLLQSQYWSADRLAEYQRERLLNLIEESVNRVPYYRDLFAKIGLTPADLRRDFALFSHIPVLTKQIIRQNHEALLTTDPTRRAALTRLSTSGSTGHPLIFYQDPAFRDNVTADIQRHLTWGGWQIGDPHAYIWGAPVNPSRQQRLRKALIDFTWNRFQTDAFTLSEASMAQFAKDLLHKKPRILFGYASAVERFAHYYRGAINMPLQLDAVFTSAETLLPPVRHLIEDTFDCHVFNRYGTLELGGVACECEAHDGLHISSENNYVEILRADHMPADTGESGVLVVSNLNNYGMPFIRYAIEDEAAWAAPGMCACGRSSPKLARLEGRFVESFKTRDGRRVWAGFAGSGFRSLAHPSICQFQVAQKTFDDIVVRLVLDDVLPSSVQAEITAAIQNTFGNNVRVAFEILDEIPPLPSGKHQYARCEIP